MIDRRSNKYAEIFNASGWARRRLPTRDPVEDYSERMKQRIRIIKPEDYPEYNVTINGTVWPVPLWQRRLQRRLRALRALEVKAVNGSRVQADDDDEDKEDNVYYFLAELLQVSAKNDCFYASNDNRTKFCSEQLMCFAFAFCDCVTIWSRKHNVLLKYACAIRNTAQFIIVNSRYV